MEVELTIDELKEIRSMYKQKSLIYSFWSERAESYDEWEYYQKLREECWKQQVKFQKLYEDECKEIGELPF